MSKIIGILGGMGPLATADIFLKIIKNTPATGEQEHLRVIIDNNPKIPSRIRAVLEGTENPLPEMIKSVKLLESAGVDFIIIPCHTAHFWLKELKPTVNVPIYSIIDITVAYIMEHHRHLLNRILLLASTATVQLNLYQKEFRYRNLTLNVPEPAEQEIVAAAIMEVKAGCIESNIYIERLNLILKRYASKGISVVLAGCTEIPLLFPFLDEKIDKLDATLILAKTAIVLAK